MVDAESSALPIESVLSHAVQGDKRALLEVCERSKVPILAAALHAGAPWPEAIDLVESTLQLLCGQLLDEKLEPAAWFDQLILQTQTIARMSTSETDHITSREGSGLSGMSAIPRLAKRRAARETLLQLPLPQLMAVLLKYIDGIGPAEMVGVVAETEAKVVSLLMAANDAIACAIQAADPDAGNW